MDGDGLSDADEEVWGGCPSAVSTSENCDGVTNPTDTDGDGFTDGTEVNQLATLPARADSDGDGISDWLEVKGFAYNGTQWYLNPNEEDSNYDGFADGYDCAVWNSLSTTYNANGICPDTDKDGSPDLFDSDNDGYENPAVDNNLNLDDHLWDVSWNLSTTFMEGRDCDAIVNEVCQSNGSRDVTITNIATTVDGWSSGTNYVAV